MIRCLSGHLRARHAQQQFYYQHLQHQYNDRLIYWQARGESRQKTLSVTCITDGMDQSKFNLPRTELMRSKEFASFQRPRLHVSALIAHGWFTIFQVSPADLPKDSNTSVELIAHAITLLKRHGAPLQTMHLTIQSDNTCRECKNSPMVRFLAGIVSSGVVGSGALGCLRAGHSHEDIDQCFGQLSRYMLRWRVHQTPGDVANCIRSFLEQAKLFEQKQNRFVVHVDQTRDWPLVAVDWNGIFSTRFPSAFIQLIVSVMVALQIAIFVFLRKGFYTAAVPIAVKGMFGPGAPHTFLLQRRCDSGQFVFCSGFNTGASRDLLAA